MKKYFIFFILVLQSLTSGIVNAQGWKWAAGCTGGCEGYGMAVDPWGNSYASGFAGGKLVFPGAVLTDFGNCGTIIVKYDPNGNFLWGKSTHNGFVKPINLSCDVNGNLYLYGYYLSDSFTFDSYSLHNPDSTSMLFLAKISPSGTVLWAKNICHGSAPGNVLASGKYLYVAATFDDTVISIGSFVFHNADPSGVTTDVVVVKYDTSGNLLKAASYGSTGDEDAYVAVAPSGKIYLAGTTTSASVTFGATMLTNSDSSMFVVRFDTSFNTLWAKNETGIGKIGSWVGGIAIDSAESAFVCGSWRPMATIGSHVLRVDTVCDIFLAKFDSTGSVAWVNEVTGNGQLGGVGVLNDYCGNVWISGGLGDQSPGHHGSNYIIIDSIQIDTPKGSNDPMFIAEWNNNGTYIKAEVLPTGGDDEDAIGIDGAGDVYVSTDYWLGPYNIAGNQLYDPVQPSENVFIAKYINNTFDSIVSRNLICISDSIVLKAPGGYSFYKWDNGSSDTALTVFKPGTYNLYCTGKCGGGIQLEVFTVDIGKMDTTYENTDASICLNAHTVLSAPSGFTPYLWSNGDTTQLDTISASGTYWVVASGTCSVPTIIDTVSVVDTSVNLAFSLGNDTVVCAPVLLSAPLTGYNYLWQDGSNGNTDWATQTGVYYLTISVLSCYNSDSITIDFPNLTQHLQDTVLCQEHPVQLLLTANVPQGASALWSTGSTNDSIYVNTAGVYWITVTDDACSGSDTMRLGVMQCACEAIFPAAFTPNGDGKNDTYGPIIDKRCDIFDYTFCIYNRWGNLIFMTHDPSAKWDGKYNEILQDVGTFMYLLEYCAGNVYNKHKLKGDLLLVR